MEIGNEISQKIRVSVLVNKWSYVVKKKKRNNGVNFTICFDVCHPMKLNQLIIEGKTSA